MEGHVSPFRQFHRLQQVISIFLLLFDLLLLYFARDELFFIF